MREKIGTNSEKNDNFHGKYFNYFRNFQGRNFDFYRKIDSPNKIHAETIFRTAHLNKFPQKVYCFQEIEKLATKSVCFFSFIPFKTPCITA